jgi:ABC-type glycerol-3-phosphate transport system permease component
MSGAHRRPPSGVASLTTILRSRDRLNAVLVWSVAIVVVVAVLGVLLALLNAYEGLPPEQPGIQQRV